MFGVLFGWRKASNKMLIKKVQCRLKLLRSKRSAIVKQLREDIAQLLRDGHEQVAFNRLDQLYMDENMNEVYELLDNFCEFVLMNLSCIRRHRNCPNEVTEAVSSLVFASARFGDLPELQVIRKLFGKRYGQKFAATAVELLPGNLVNPQMKDKLFMNSVSEYAKNRLLDEIIRECFFKPGLLAIEYNSSPKLSQAVKLNDTQSMASASLNSSDAKESEENPTSDFEFNHSTIEQNAIIIPYPQNQTPDSSSEYPEQSLVYLDDIEEFKSPARKDSDMVDEQDQRMFIFKPLQIKTEQPQSPSVQSMKKSVRKRQRRRSISKDYKQSINDTAYEVYYSGSPHQKKHQKVTNLGGENDLDGRVQSFRFWLKEDESKTESRRQSSSSSNGVLKRPPYLRAKSMPEQRQKQSRKIDFGRSSSLPMEKPAELNRGASSSPRHVHPKLPDYDELEAKFMALKKVHQQTKLVMNAK
ncbi:hypothetical protein V2J09_019170 [Rumex salicifolius]